MGCLCRCFWLLIVCLFGLGFVILYILRGCFEFVLVGGLVCDLVSFRIYEVVMFYVGLCLLFSF